MTLFLCEHALVLEFNNNDTSAFDEVIEVLKRHPDFDRLYLTDETMLSIQDLEIYPDRRKIFRNRKEINLTTKEYDLFYLLVKNKGRVLTYEQIYRNVWGETAIGNECNAVKCHIHNLREKLYTAVPKTAFTIRCVREVGYCFEEKIVL